ncbi:MAG: helix-turn-helix transcriptional regulator [Deltaproteobacteria bacterium]|nr:helix-turn-helix transcriptional regulator [Deltaproteobacteria bacterium]
MDRKADIPYTTLTKIETGVIKKPSVFVMAKLAKTLGVSRFEPKTIGSGFLIGQASSLTVRQDA